MKTATSSIRKHELLTKHYIRHSDILEILDSKDSKLATKIITAIISKAKKDGQTLLYERGAVPVRLFVERVGIDIEEVYKNAKKEMELNRTTY